MQSFPSEFARRPAVDHAFARFLSTTYAWMAGGLALSGGVAYGVANSPAMQRLIFGNTLVMLLAFVAQFAMVWTLSSKVATLSGRRAGALFLTYSALSGMTLSSLALIYTRAALTQAFATTALSFA